ncbi:MAG TPA: response regulator [Roseiarcus sp.]|nr:response regulator [Roseiarcus sp.]
MERDADGYAPEAVARPLTGARILVVEDDFFISMELEAILSEAGGEVGLCRTVRDALVSVEKNAPSVAVLDFRMGEETTARVADRLNGRNVPFAFYTGQAEVDPLRAQWPTCKIVSKPARPQTLVNAVADLLLGR